MRATATTERELDELEMAKLINSEWERLSREADVGGLAERLQFAPTVGSIAADLISAPEREIEDEISDAVDVLEVDTSVDVDTSDFDELPGQQTVRVLPSEFVVRVGIDLTWSIADELAAEVHA